MPLRQSEIARYSATEGTDYTLGARSFERRNAFDPWHQFSQASLYWEPLVGSREPNAPWSVNTGLLGG